MESFNLTLENLAKESFQYPYTQANVVHWKRIEHRLGKEIAQKLSILHKFYSKNKTSHFFKKEDTLLAVGEIIKNQGKALFVICPDFEDFERIPGRLIDFENSEIKRVLDYLNIKVELLISTKEYFEKFENTCTYADYNNSLEKLKGLLNSRYSCHLMTEDSAINYSQNFLPSNQGSADLQFRVPQVKHILSLEEMKNHILIQTEIYNFPKNRSFYKEAFENKPTPVIGYRTPKKL